jgi:anaerobic ribonucleoside-triphosphate reductase activating protein
MEMDARKETLLRLSTPPDGMTVARHSGPGLRLIFWVQGCSLLCTRNCLNPHLLKRDGGYLITASDLERTLRRLASDFVEVEGLTVLGGEPFDQAGALAQALAPVRADGLSVMVYTGHTLEALRQSDASGVRQLLELCDILVDGSFVDELYDESLVWRGSLNQRVLLLSNRYTPEDIERALAFQQRAVSISRNIRGDLSVSGAQKPEDARRLRRLTRPATPARGNTSPVLETRK